MSYYRLSWNFCKSKGGSATSNYMLDSRLLEKQSRPVVYIFSDFILSSHIFNMYHYLKRPYLDQIHIFLCDTCSASSNHISKICLLLTRLLWPFSRIAASDELFALCRCHHYSAFSGVCLSEAACKAFKSGKLQTCQTAEDPCFVPASHHAPLAV